MSGLVTEVHSNELKKVVSEGITLVDFWASWCGPCRIQGSILEELAGGFKGKAKIAKVNVDEAEDVAEQFGVMAIPTLILFKDGKEVRRLIGVQSKEILVDTISSAL